VSVDERSIMAAVALGSPEVGGGGAEEDVVVMMLLLIERGVGRPPLPLIILLGRLFDTATSCSWPASGRRAEGVVAFFLLCSPATSRHFTTPLSLSSSGEANLVDATNCNAIISRHVI
jgi:hypothetical protein